MHLKPSDIFLIGLALGAIFSGLIMWVIHTALVVIGIAAVAVVVTILAKRWFEHKFRFGL